MSRLSGAVKWFDAKKGFGFIVGPEGQDVFVHFSSIEGDGFRTLKDGEPVEYEMIKGDKGMHAKAVKRLRVKATETPSVAKV
ncbi:MAG: cold shock domain-containing protein [Tepidisphaeraceae bacterium]